MRGTGTEKCSANVANVLFLSFFFLGSLTTFAVCVCVSEMFSENCSFFLIIAGKKTKEKEERKEADQEAPAHLS
jgi:hypothetical protein